MIRNQCRYCVNLTVTDVHGCYCDAKEEFRSEESCKRKIKCPCFDFCMIDAFHTQDYSESKWKRAPKYEQLKLF